MARAGISGFGIVSALGAGVAATRRGLFADDPKLPELPKGFATKLDLPVFEVEPPAGAPDDVGLPLKYLLFALDEALAAAKLTRENLRKLRVGLSRKSSGSIPRNVITVPSAVELISKA